MMQHELFPPEVTTGVPRVILTGDDKVWVEQHRGLIRCETECISLRTACGTLVISGQGLSLRRYTATEALVTGSIDSVAMQREGRRG